MSEGLDPVIHPPKRLAVMAILAHSSDADFTFLRAHLRVSDSVLSKHMSVLIDAGYVSVNKTGRGRGSVTTYRITKDGTKAYRAYRETLDTLLAGLPPEPGKE